MSTSLPELELAANLFEAGEHARKVRELTKTKQLALLLVLAGERSLEGLIREEC